MPTRDALGRPVPDGSPEAVPPVPEQALPPREALALAQQLLDDGRAFFAHEVLEAVWKDQGRDRYWQGLAQLCVGITHLQRGNPTGAVTLLRRGAGNVDALDAPLASWARTEADRVAAGDLALPRLRLPAEGPVRQRGCAAPQPGPG